MNRWDADEWERIKLAVARVAEDQGMEPHQVYRDIYREHRLPHEPSDRLIRRLGLRWRDIARSIAGQEVGAVPVTTGPSSEEDVPVLPVPEGHRVKGVSTLVGANGSTIAQWVKTDREREDREAAIREMLASLPEFVPARVGSIAPPTEQLSDELLAVYPIGDPHLGMLAWAPETGQNWDLSKGVAILEKAIDDLVQRGARTSKAILAPLGDVLHSDDDRNRTRRSGHHLDVDGRWTKIMKATLGVVVYLVDRTLQHHAVVDVIIPPGNHDDLSAQMISIGLAAYYRNEPRVHVETEPSHFYYRRHGDVLLGFTHGHTSKRADLGAIMATDQPRHWGETTHRHWITGHVHHSSKDELRGCTVETFRTLTARDHYAHTAGYRSGRDMHRIVYHQTRGEVERSIVHATSLEQ